MFIKTEWSNNGGRLYSRLSIDFCTKTQIIQTHRRGELISCADEYLLDLENVTRVVVFKKPVNLQVLSKSLVLCRIAARLTCHK